MIGPRRARIVESLGRDELLDELSSDSECSSAGYRLSREDASLSDHCRVVSECQFCGERREFRDARDGRILLVETGVDDLLLGFAD